jgi:hypothetical protein
MGLLNVQTAIAKLCLSRASRTEFLGGLDAAAPAPVDADAEALRQLSVDVLAEFGERLIQKRIGFIRSWLPLSFAALDRKLTPERVNAHLDRFTQEYIRCDDEYAGEWKRKDSARVGAYLQTLVRNGTIPLPPLVDVLSYEIAYMRLRIDLEAARSARAAEAVAAPEGGLSSNTWVIQPPHVALAEYTFDVPLLIRLIESDFGIGGLRADPSWVLFIRQPTGAAVKTHAIGQGIYQLLSACASPRRLGDLVTAMRVAFGTQAEMETAIRAEIASLVQIGALTVLSHNSLTH